MTSGSLIYLKRYKLWIHRWWHCGNWLSTS